MLGKAQASADRSGNSGNSVDGGWRLDSRIRRLDMPVFDGSDPDGWVFWIERYFNVNRMTEEEKWEAAVVYLDGNALAWFQWKERR